MPSYASYGETNPERDLNKVVEAQMKEEPLPDSRFAWVIVIAAFFIHVVALGFLYSFGRNVLLIYRNDF